jgi:hypothetical protein
MTISVDIFEINKTILRFFEILGRKYTASSQHINDLWDINI